MPSAWRVWRCGGCGKERKMNKRTFSVTQLTNYISAAFELDDVLSAVSVTGEISNFKCHSSGHLYFSVIDEEAKLNAVMFAGNVRFLSFTPKNGMKVVLHGNVGVYAKSGTYQLYVSRMEISENVENSFQRLLKEYSAKGYIRSEPGVLPMLPMTIALVTSPTSAAVRDMISVLSRRAPCVRLIVAPVTVQGDGAAAEISAMLQYINQKKIAELIILGRGGGSSEDLSAFNEEKVVASVRASKIPVISAVGHETDFALSDFAAHRRAATPSMAAEIAVPDIMDMFSALGMMRNQLSQLFGAKLAFARQRITRLSASPVINSPDRLFAAKTMELGYLSDRLHSAFDANIGKAAARLSMAEYTLSAASPEAILRRGYVYVKRNGVVIKGDQIKTEDTLELVSAGLTAEAKVLSLKER